jgi:PhzF family phenazine biosynthesis protein
LTRPTIGAAVHTLSTLHPSASTSHSTLKGRLLAPAGAINVSLDPSKVASADIPHNVHIHTENPPSLEDIYQLQPVLRGVFSPSNVSETVKLVSTVKGMTFFHIELPSLETLGKTATTSTRPDAVAKMDQEWNKSLVGAYFYAFTAEPSIKDDVEHFQVQSRMFMAGLEDPATGSAACGLVSMLALTKSKCRTVDVEIVQGVEQERKSVIGVKVTLNEKRNAVESVQLKGSAVKVMQGTLEV